MNVGSSRRDSFLAIQEGQRDPLLGKMVDTLIARCDDYVVYLDEDLYVEWATDTHFDGIDGSADVLNRVSWLETKPKYMLGDDEQKRTYGRMVGEGVARMLSERIKEANTILDQAEGWIDARSQEAARRWLLTGSAVAALPLVIAGTSLWLFRQPLYVRFGTQETDVIIGACVGAGGALLSIIWRTGKQGWEPEAGPRLHYCEALARIIAGMFGAVVMTLAVRADLLGGVLARASSHSAMFLLAFVAGFSERLVPGFVSRVETSLGSEQSIRSKRTP